MLNSCWLPVAYQSISLPLFNRQTVESIRKKDGNSRMKLIGIRNGIHFGFKFPHVFLSFFSHQKWISWALRRQTIKIEATHGSVVHSNSTTIPNNQPSHALNFDYSRSQWRNPLIPIVMDIVRWGWHDAKKNTIKHLKAIQMFASPSWRYSRGLLRIRIAFGRLLEFAMVIVCVCWCLFVLFRTTFASMPCFIHKNIKYYVLMGFSMERDCFCWQSGSVLSHRLRDACLGGHQKPLLVCAIN